MTETSMPPQISTKRDQAAKDKVERILEAALTCFAAKGFNGTTVPEVANRAGVGAGTIYRYFDNKEALVNAVFCEAKRTLKRYLIESINFDDPLRTVFHVFWKNLNRFTQENPIRFHFLELQDHVPYMDDTSKKVELEVLAPIWAIMVLGRDHGEIRDMPAEALIAMVWGTFVGLKKAQILGYVDVTEKIMQQTEGLCWQMVAKTD